MIPQPKYDIGDKVWVGRYELRQETIECPDCLGSGYWHVTTPAGEEFDQLCTCSEFTGPNGRVSERSWGAYAAQYTIGSIRVDTNEHERSPISYMCKETGIGSGSIWHEDQLFDTHDEALRHGQYLGKKLFDENEARYLAQEERNRVKAKYKPSYEKRKIRELEKEIKRLKKEIKDGLRSGA